MIDPLHFPREWWDRPQGGLPVGQPPVFPGWRFIGAVYAKKQAGGGGE